MWPRRSARCAGVVGVAGRVRRPVRGGGGGRRHDAVPSRRRRPGRAGRARARRPGVAGHLVRGGGRPISDAVGRASWRPRPAGRDRAPRSDRRLRGARRRPGAGHGGRQRGRPRAPRAHVDATPSRCSGWCARAGAVFLGPWAPASVGDYVAGPSHVLPTDRSARFASALRRRGLPQAHPRGRGRPDRARAAGAARRRHRRRPRGCRPTPSPSACGTRDDARPRDAARHDLGLGSRGLPLAAGRGGGAAQHQRVTPSRRPPAGSTALRGRARTVDRCNRYPDRGRRGAARALADLHGVAPEQVFCANGSNEVLQSLLPRLRRPGPDGRGLRADLRPARPHRPADRHRGGRGRARRRLLPGSRRGEAGVARRRPSPAITFLCSPNNPTGLADDPRRSSRRCSARRRAWSWSTRPTASSPTGRRCRAGRRRPPPGRHPHLLQDLVAGAACGSATWSGRPAVVAALERVALPYHLDAVKQAAGRLALRFVGEMEDRVGADRRASGDRLGGAARRPAGDVVAVARRTSSCSGPGQRDGRRGLAGLLDRSVLVRDMSTWPGLDGLPAGDRRHARGERRFLAALLRRGRWRRLTDDLDRAPPARRRTARRDQGDDIEVAWSTSTATGHGVDVDHRPAVLRPHGRPARQARRVRPDRAGRRVTSTSTPTTPSRTSGSCSARRCARPSGDKAGVRRFASIDVPLDEALIEVALDLSGRPYLSTRWTRRRRGGLSARLPAVRPAAGRGVLAGLRDRRRHHAARRMRSGRNTHHILEASFKGVARAPARRRARRGRRRALHQGRAADAAASRCSTTASATCARPRRPRSTSAPTPRWSPIRTRRRGADGVVLPGVGAFGRCMEALRATGLDRVALEAVDRGALPRHLRRDARCSRGLRGGPRRRRDSACCAGRAAPARGVKRPQMQWNQLDAGAADDAGMLDGLGAEPWVYFVHSLRPGHPGHSERRRRHVRLRRRRGRRAIGPGRVGDPVPPGEVGYRRLRILGNFVTAAAIPAAVAG